MEITIKDILRAILKKWYIFFSIISICVAVGTGIAVKNYNQPKYTSSISFLFGNVPSSGVGQSVNDCRAYLATDYIIYSVRDAVDEAFPGHNGYQVNIDSMSSTLTISVTAQNEDITIFVLNNYSDIITSDDNPIRKDGLSIDDLVPVYSREEKDGLTSLGMQIALFGFIGLFISGIIILTPLYSEKAKEERVNRIIQEYKEKLERERKDTSL